jgi:transposase InsO family protein
MGPVKRSYLYVILDIFSRRVVGWRGEHAESAAQFKELFIDAMEKHAVPRDQLTLHADRGGSPLVHVNMHCQAMDEGHNDSANVG